MKGLNPSGRGLWSEIRARNAQPLGETVSLEMPAYGEPVLVKPRLGQGAFR